MTALPINAPSAGEPAPRREASIGGMLRDLARINTDSALFFEAAVQHLDDPNLRALFSQTAEVRRGNAEQLRSALAAAGEPADGSGSVLGALHRLWTEVRGVVQGRDEHAVLAEAERSEDAVKRCYERARGEADAGGGPGPFAAMLDEHQAKARAVHDRVRMMRDLTA